MSEADFDEVQRILLEALEQAPEARAAFVESAAAGVVPLRDEVMELLVAEASEGPNLETAGVLRSMAEGLSAEGQTIGVYHLQSLLGVGGMGEVYLARQEAPVRRNVALKLIKLGMDTREALQRFDAERQALARMKHPNIAGVFDAGSTEDGRPYFVMELVEGSPLTDYADASTLDVDARVRLLVEVCRGVQHAHQRGIIHRDLKPSNILVDLQDDGPVPKIIDFGVAKATHGDGRLATLASHQGQLVGTPEYMSPEQADPTEDDIDSRSDVYALGAILYELLSGSRPFQGPEHRSLDGLLSQIRDGAPTRLTRALARTDPGVRRRVARERGMKAGALAGALRGDLEWIVAKAMARARAHRYDSAAELAADLERYLNGQPVLAGPPSMAYAVGKFVGRHRVAVAASLLTVLAGVAMVAFYTGRLRSERDRARRSEQRARVVSGVLSDVFRSASPHESKGAVVTAVDLLRAARSKVDELHEQPRVQAELYRTMGASYTGLGDYGAAEPLLHASAELLERVSPPDPLGLADTLDELSDLQREMENHEVAIATRRRAVDLKTAELGPSHPEVVRLLGRLAATYGAANRIEEAVSLGAEALALKQQVSSEPDSVTLDLLGNLAVDYNKLGWYQEATARGREVAELSREIIGPLAPNTVIRFGNMGGFLRRQYLFEEALEYYEGFALDGAKVWPTNHEIFSVYLGGQAIALRGLGRFDEANAVIDEVCRVLRTSRGEDTADYCNCLYQRGAWLLDRGEVDAARTHFARGRALAEKLSHGRFIGLLTLALGAAEMRAGAYAEAEPRLQLSMKDDLRVGRDDVLAGQRALAELLSRTGRRAEATERFLAVLTEQEGGAGEDSPALVPTLTAFSEHWLRVGEFAKAEAWARRAVGLAGPWPDPSWLRALAEAARGRALQAMGRDAEAAAVLTGARTVLIDAFGAHDPRVPVGALP